MHFDRLSAEARHILAQVRSADDARIRTMVDRLALYFAQHGWANAIDVDAVIDSAVRRYGAERHSIHLQERHLVNISRSLFSTSSPLRYSQSPPLQPC